MSDTPQPAPAEREKVKAISRALEIFARRITSADTLAGIRQVIENGGTAKIDITARKNEAGKITLRLDCASKFQHDTLTFGGLS